VNEVRSGVPGLDVLPDDPITRCPDGDGIFQARPRIVAKITRKCDAD